MMQQLAYQPLLPNGNKYLQQKWEKAYDLHKRKVKSAKPTINTTTPQTFGHLALKLKKQKLEEEWNMKTQRENNMLKEKILHIMRTTGGVDNRNDYVRKSLGREKRQLELLRITKENQMILFRLSQCRSHYNVRSWHEDWQETLKLRDSIARYPRGGANQEKGQEEPSKRSRECDQNQKLSNTTEHNKTNSEAACEGNEVRKDTGNKEDTETEMPKEKATLTPKLSEDDKSQSADTTENPGSSDNSK
ncbi:uncharacterized protein CFAP97D1 [Parambassis ranga]|uniref:Uncharacterized protein CFAP97D1 n=1 Tax=Parambassis ranga TaxID=210632 RepID=A0A6P7HBP9_9TELE|nr:uncharacterized protein CFAP97D1-like [Parambassis ranga]